MSGSEVTNEDGTWPTLCFDEAKTKRLRKRYDETGDDVEFEFEGHTYYRAYAHYLLEMLELRFVQD